MTSDPALVPFWIRFVGQPELQHSYGVTARSLDDALELLKKHHLVGQEIDTPIAVTAGVRIQDLDQERVVPSCGPMVFRGVWYPCLNLGDEAS